VVHAQEEQGRNDGGDNGKDVQAEGAGEMGEGDTGEGAERGDGEGQPGTLMQ
jgi:hypothetical protein